MNINEIVLSIVKRPSFNLLAFQGLTFISLLLAGQLVAWELMLFNQWNYMAIEANRIVYTLLFGILILPYTLCHFITKCHNKTLSSPVVGKRFIGVFLIIFYVLFSIFMLPINYDKFLKELQEGGGIVIVMLFCLAIYAIVLFSIIPLIITLITEQIRGTRIENLPYLDSKLKLTSVVFCAAFPIIFWSFIAIKLIYF